MAVSPTGKDQEAPRYSSVTKDECLARCSTESSFGRLTGRLSIMNDRMSTLSAADRDSLRDSLNVAQKWVVNGYNPFKQDQYGYTALHRAARKGDDKMVLSLVDSFEGEKIDLLTVETVRHKQSAIQIAARSGHTNIVQIIAGYKLGPRVVDHRDKHGNAALHFATAKANKEPHASMLAVILEGGGDPNITNTRGLTPLALFIMATKEDVVDPVNVLLLHGADPDSRMNDGSTLLHLAISRRLIKIACRLVAAGANVNLADGSGNMVSEIAPRAIYRMLLRHITIPPVWVALHERTSCMVCKEPFSFIKRRHHCRHCGRLCCGPCSIFKKPLAIYGSIQSKFKTEIVGNDKPHRVCNTCYKLTSITEESHAKNNFLAKGLGYDYDQTPFRRSLIR